MTKQTYFFCGIGGHGMNALAQILLARGHGVAGSDRAYDMGIEQTKFQTLKNLGAQLYPQDGSGIAKSHPDFFVVSTAVEDTIPDVKAARDAGLEIIHRADLLVQLSQSPNLMTVGGTSGKSTTTAMLGHIMQEAGENPMVINGAGAVNQPNQKLSLAREGGGQTSAVEVDESDGSISKFQPNIAVLNNISLDHKTMDELRALFTGYLDAAKTGVVLNLDCLESMELPVDGKKVVTFSYQNPDADFYATNVTPEADGIAFKVNGETPVKLAVFGWYNVANGLAAIAAASLAGVAVEVAAKAFQSFAGMRRRLERVGLENGILVLDDFAHNPHKIAATLKALKEYPGRVFLVYQPHGFGPTKMMRDDLIKVFSELMAPEDKLYMPEIYFVGGTADKSISSKDLTDAIAANGRRAEYLPRREDIATALRAEARPGDRICVMGARDNTLSDFAHSILTQLKKKTA